VILIPTEDVVVGSYQPNSNFGGYNTLGADARPVWISYLKFDLSYLMGKDIKKAKLKLYVTNSSAGYQNIKSISNSNWNEYTLTYNRRLAMDGVLGYMDRSAKNTWSEVDVTSYVKSKLGKQMSIGIDSYDGDGLVFYSKDNSSNKPQLIVTYR
jgi:hypothetical protein